MRSSLQACDIKRNHFVSDSDVPSWKLLEPSWRLFEPSGSPAQALRRYPRKKLGRKLKKGFFFFFFQRTNVPSLVEPASFRSFERLNRARQKARLIPSLGVHCVRSLVFLVVGPSLAVCDGDVVESQPEAARVRDGVTQVVRVVSALSPVRVGIDAAARKL